MLKRNRLAATMTAVSLALAAPLALPAMAQNAPQTAPQEAPAAPMMTVDEAQLDAFVAALRTVDQMEQEYTETLQQAETDEQRQEIVSEANTAMAEAIENTPGMTLDDYVSILQAAQADPALSARIMERLEADSAG
ncbi:DUF4168 domain-containing protein [Pararhodobacter sp. SW119]|uniref:DUF4168 domain-containing protein n=1 Tax=Pararhodobacter sp. SW119 TaxID=2780075 RepID=UPI001AE065ED|nr:DUF4168 domain-containing protein [Pararhodobacter sp. SW119]